jgi:hypothetical protein
MSVDTDEENAAYHRDPALGSSGIKLLYERSPMHFYADYIDPDRVRRPPTPAMLFGTCLHMAILEPLKARQMIAAIPSDAPEKRSKADKEWWAAFNAEHAHQILLSEEDYVRLLRTRDAVLAHPVAGGLIDECTETEVAIKWRDADRQINCKAKPDGLARKLRVTIDLKSCDDASPRGFKRAIQKYRYPIQAAWYSDAIERETGYAHSFVWIAAETQAPHGVGVYQCGDATLRWGRAVCEESANTYARCLRSGQWPSYPQEVQVMEMDRWALRLEMV